MENDEDRERRRRWRCDMLQGTAYSMPLKMQLGNSLLSHSAKAGIQVVNSGLAAASAEVVAEKDRTRRMLKSYFEFPSEKKFQAKVDR